MTVRPRALPGGVRVLAAEGEIDVRTADVLLPSLAELVGGARAVVLDLTDVTFFDSSGCRLVDRLAHECGRVHAALRVVAPPGSPPRQVLRIVGMEQGLVCDSLRDAEAALSGTPTAHRDS